MPMWAGSLQKHLYKKHHLLLGDAIGLHIDEVEIWRPSVTA